jgi:hypothetical protein
MISIGATQITTPASMVVTIREVKNETYNANGGIIIDVKSKKRDVELAYTYLSASALSTLLTLLAASTTFSLSYPDPETGTTRTGTFFCRDRSMGAIDFQAGVMRYKDISFSLGEV